MSNYLKKLAKKQWQSAIYEINVYHDDWCDLLSGKGECNCDPEIKIVGMTGMTYKGDTAL